MNNYKDFEEKVFQWLLKKHEADKSFTFSLRQKANKGAELDYFIGTENSNYFGTTFWYVPVYFPGSSTDLINLMFRLTDSGYNYYIQFNQTRNPPDKQNQAALALIIAIKAQAKKIFSSTYENGPGKKMEYFQIDSHAAEYKDIDTMLADADADLGKIMPLVDAAITSAKAQDPEFRAGRYSVEDFDKMLDKLKQRRLIHSSKKSVPDIDIEDEIQLPANEDEEWFPLNQILYGPPGTGKTFNTVNKAVAIANPVFNIEASSREQIHEEYDRLVENKFIRFTTFHQSLSYEDFIEGIKPKYDSIIETLTYPVKPGIFKSICFSALKATYNANIEVSNEVNFETLWKRFIDSLKNSFKDDDFPFETKEKSEMRADKTELEKGRIVTYYRWSNNSTKTIAGKTPFPINPEKIKEMYEEGITDNETNLKKRLKPILTYHLSPYYAVYKSFLSYLKSSIGEQYSAVIDQEDFDDDAVEYDGCLNQLRVLQQQNKLIKKGAPYVLIIDEINRGNVSQIFGELITLLEEDKRFGKSEGLTIKLPYSQTDFVVPDNLYIVGTMNTADRSVEALDTALRRRFVFEEMMPDSSLLNPQKMRDSFLTNYKEIILGGNKYDEERSENLLESFYSMIGYDTQTNAFFEPAVDDNEPTVIAPLAAGFAKISLPDSAIRLDRMLETINARIAKLLSKDQQIGHAFFINAISVEQVYDIFYQKLIPQLQEYFYGDFGKVGLILGSSFITLDNTQVTFADFEYEDSDLLQQRKVYETINFIRNGAIDFIAFTAAVRHIYASRNGRQI